MYPYLISKWTITSLWFFRIAQSCDRWIDNWYPSNWPFLCVSIRHCFTHEACPCLEKKKIENITKDQINFYFMSLPHLVPLLSGLNNLRALLANWCMRNAWIIIFLLHVISTTSYRGGLGLKQKYFKNIYFFVVGGAPPCIPIPFTNWAITFLILIIIAQSWPFWIENQMSHHLNLILCQSDTWFKIIVGKGDLVGSRMGHFVTSQILIWTKKSKK